MNRIRLWCELSIGVCLSLAMIAPALAQDNAAARQKDAFRWVNPPPEGMHSRVQHSTYQSAIQDAEIGYAIYLPPQYNDPALARERFPVVYYLHGGRPGSESKSVRMAEYFDAHIRQKVAPPMIYVFVNGGLVSHYDYAGERSWGERTFLEELIPHIDKTYRTIAGKAGRGLEGFSQGGRGTARIAFAHPELFCSAAPMGGGHQHEKNVSEHKGKEDGPEGYEFPEKYNTWDLARQYAKRKEQIDLLVVVGTKDFNYEANLEWIGMDETPDGTGYPVREDHRAGCSAQCGAGV